MKSAVAAIAFAAAAQASPVAKTIEVRGEEWKADGPFYFTSTYEVIASPNQVVDSENEFTGGLEGCTGMFNYGINVHENVICYNITIDGFSGDFESPANSATHIHEGAKGMAGPPRIAFPDPKEMKDGRLNSIGCLRGPFMTGLDNDETGEDTGKGFHVKQIEEDPAAFFTDIHSSEAVPGATRGQLSKDHC